MLNYLGVLNSPNAAAAALPLGLSIDPERPREAELEAGLGNFDFLLVDGGPDTPVEDVLWAFQSVFTVPIDLRFLFMVDFEKTHLNSHKVNA